MSIALRRLREEAVIDVRFGGIAIRDPAKLVAYAAPMLDIYELEALEFGARTG